MLISLNESKFVNSGVLENIRADGRQRLEFRQCVLETGLLPQASGSCRIQIYDAHGIGKTDILVGVKVEIGNIAMDELDEEELSAVANEDSARFSTETDEDGLVDRAYNSAFDRGRLVCNVECAPSVVDQSDGSKRLDELEKELSSIVDSVLNSHHSGIELDKLVIVPKQQCWVIYVDALVLSHGGQPLDALLMGCFAALQQTRIPKATLVTLETGEVDFEVDDNPSLSSPIPGCMNMPIGVTLCKVGDQFIVDPTSIEAGCASAKFLIAVNQWGKVCFLSKLGGGTVPFSQVPTMVKAGRVVGTGLIRKLVTFLESEDSKGEVGGKGFLY